MTREFIKRLEEKLRIGTLRGIHLNALPGRYATRLDLFSLSYLESHLPNRFLDLLLKETDFNFSISFDRVRISQLQEEEQTKLNLIAKRLNMLAYENEDNFLEHGVKTFGFGFPLLVKRTKKDPTRVIKAPLVIWNLDIEKSQRRANEWFIRREEDFSIAQNGVLFSHLESDEEVQIAAVTKEILEDGIVDSHELLGICRETLSKLNVDSFPESLVSLTRCPDRESIENLSTDVPSIIWSGIFGLYRVQKESIIKDLKNLRERFDSFEFEKLVVERYQTSTVSSVATDPSQEQIVNSIGNKNTKIIQGPPGTGKSQSLTALITNALDSGAKCLVVCEKKTALDVIHQNLKTINLDYLSVIIDDVGRDRKAVIDAARAAIDRIHNTGTNPHDLEYSQRLSEYEETKQKLNKRLKAVLSCIHGDDSWKDLVGRYLRAQRSADLNLESLKREEYSYDFEEYNRLIGVVRIGEKLFRVIGTLEHPLGRLSSRLFEGPFLVSQERFLHEQLNELSKQVRTVLIETDRLKSYPAFFANRSILVDVSAWIYFLFAKKGRYLRQIRGNVIAQREKLSETHQQLSLFGYSFKSLELLKDFWAITSEMKAYSDLLDSLLGNWSSFEEYYEWRAFFVQLDKATKNLVQTLAAKSKKWSPSFEAWYFDNVLRKYERKVGPFLRNDNLNDDYQALSKVLKELQKNRIQQTWDLKLTASLRRHEGQRGHVKTLYNYRGNKQFTRKNSLRSIINADFRLFTDFFPVVLVNPSVCASIMPLKEALFDVVIFDEASQLRLEDTYSSLVRGKYKIVSGDKHQMPPSSYFMGTPIMTDGEDTGESQDENGDEEIKVSSIASLAESESLLKFAEDSNYAYSYLDFHYRSRHPFLIDFSNAAFYGSRLIPMPERIEYRPIRLINAGGIYEKDGTNPQEARTIVEILSSEIKPKPDGTYPSVGVATLNIYQRNLILDLIREKYITDKEFQVKYQHLIDSGLFVKNLENIQGDERDIILMSTTFGLRADGSFAQHFGPLNQQHGHRLLNVIITRAKHLFYVVTSIPKNYYESFDAEIGSKGNSGKGVFYAYVAYARAIEDNDEKRRQAILDLLRTNCSEKSVTKDHGFVESPFEQEVFDRLSQHIDPKCIEPQHWIGGFRVDFLIKSASGKPSLVIECDGKQYHASNEAYAFDKFRQKQIEAFGLRVHRIWSTNWWNKQDEELKKVLRIIEEMPEPTEVISSEMGVIAPIEQLPTLITEPQILYSIDRQKKVSVGPDSVVELKDLVTNEKFKVKLTQDRGKVSLESDEIKVIHADSPLGRALLGKGLGDRCRLDGLDAYYEVLAISDDHQ